MQNCVMCVPGSVTRSAAPPTDLRELGSGRRGSGAAAASAAAASVMAAARAGPAMLKRAPAALGLTDARRDAPDGGTGRAECLRAGSFAAGAAAAGAAAVVPTRELPVHQNFTITSRISYLSCPVTV